MATPNVKKSDPRPLHSSTSFSKLNTPEPERFSRPQRASTVQNGASSEAANRNVMTRANTVSESHPDRFDKMHKDDGVYGAVESSEKLPPDFDELPIELASLTDSFIDSLSAKVHPMPPSVDKLSGLFQDFYAIAATHISTHISALSSRQHREKSPAPSVTSLSNKLRAKAASISTKERPRIPLERKDSEQQMLTVEEIADRKRARKLLEQKRLALEEAVERRVCEGIYDRIFRHRSTQDEAQDEKLRSKTAALSVVGIGLTDLGIDLGNSPERPDSTEEKESEVREWLEDARKQLVAMSDDRYPLGKLHHLKLAHKSIVDTLSHFHPSSSADEIMPMLIYTLITSRPEGISIISNLYFIQRFRNESKIDGEAAYCLTNLEAAITFLETVDLASLRADEVPQGPPKSNSRPSTPKLEKPAYLTGLTPSPVVSTVSGVSSIVASPTTIPSPSSTSSLRPSFEPHNRRISDMFRPPVQALGEANDAFFNSADQSFKTIGNSLGDSYKFLLGKIKDTSLEIAVPKTLDEARKLVSTPPPEDDASASGASSLHTPDIRRDESATKIDDKMLSLIGGLKTTRDRSTDSARSSGSNRRAAEEGGERTATPSPLHSAPVSSAMNPPIVESMRNLGNSLNPMNMKIAGMGMMRGFGRANTIPVPPSATANKALSDGGVADLTTAHPDLAQVLPPKAIPKIAPPIKKFMDLQNPGDMKLNEVLELLRDYRRLAGALKDMGAV